MQLSVRSLFLVCVWSILAGNSFILAQCDRVGWVSAIKPDCGVSVIDLISGEKLLIVSGGESLSPGQTFTFGAISAQAPAPCPYPDFATISLTCLNESPIPCKALFDTKASILNPLTRIFEAKIFDPSSQICTWSFGDGTEQTGTIVQHTFSQEGAYEVCLKVSAISGTCAEYSCETLLLTDQNPAWCAYELAVTESGGQIYGVLAGNGDHLKSVTWYEAKSGAVLSVSPTLQFTPASPGTYVICVSYQASLNDGAPLCEATLCQTVSYDPPHCHNQQIAVTDILCPRIYAPVCGCDGITYANECEALAVGAVQWRPGACGGSTGVCYADMQHELIHADLTQGTYTVRFTNLSVGGTFRYLDFGDGSPMWQPATHGETHDHTYMSGGIYKATFTVWANNVCVSSLVSLISTDSQHEKPQNVPVGTDYVLPGDANGDKKANVYDLLNIGVGYGALGMPRPNANTSWTQQFAPDWPAKVNNHVNFKHLDCDGSGLINEFDVDPIVMHYAPTQPKPVFPNPGRPPVRLQFNQDTVTLHYNNPTNVVITGDILVGSAQRPVLGLHGLAFSMMYPEYVKPNNSIAYEQNSFMGFINHLLVLSKDNYSLNQMDVGITRKLNVGANGYGKVGQVNFTLDFIIIVDIIDRAGSNVIPFVVPVAGLEATDALGKPFDLSVPADLDTVWVKIEGFVPTNESQDLSDLFSVFPNPASDQVHIFVAENIPVKRLFLTDALGKTRISQHTADPSSRIQLDVRGLSTGLYTLHLITDRGVAEKRVLIAR